MLVVVNIDAGVAFLVYLWYASRESALTVLRKAKQGLVRALMCRRGASKALPMLPPRSSRHEMSALARMLLRVDSFNAGRPDRPRRPGGDTATLAALRARLPDVCDLLDMFEEKWMNDVQNRSKDQAGMINNNNNDNWCARYFPLWAEEGGAGAPRSSCFFKQREPNAFLFYYVHFIQVYDFFMIQHYSFMIILWTFFCEFG